MRLVIKPDELRPIGLSEASIEYSPLMEHKKKRHILFFYLTAPVPVCRKEEEVYTVMSSFPKRRVHTGANERDTQQKQQQQKHKVLELKRNHTPSSS